MYVLLCFCVLAEISFLAEKYFPPKTIFSAKYVCNAFVCLFVLESWCVCVHAMYVLDVFYVHLLV